MERDLVTEAIVAAKKRMASFEGFIAEKDEASTKFIAWITHWRQTIAKTSFDSSMGNRNNIIEFASVKGRN